MLFTRGRLQIGETVMINSVGSGIGSAAVQLAHARRGDRDRQRELGRQARAGGRARNGSRDQPRDAGRRRRGDASDRRIVASISSSSTSAATCSRTGSTHSARTAGSSSAAGTPARSSRSTSSRSSARRSRSSARSSITRTEVESCLELARDGRITPLVHQTFAARRRARGDGDDGAPRALRQDRPQALKGAR